MNLGGTHLQQPSWLERRSWTFGLVAATLPPKEGGFALALLILGVLRPSARQVREALAEFWPLLLLFLLGCIGTYASIDYGFSPLDAARSMFYLARIPVLFMLGAMTVRRGHAGPKLLWQLFLVGSCLALFYIVRYALDPEVRFATRDYVRSTIGHGEASSALVPFVAALLWRRAEGSASKAVLITGMLLSVVSIVLATSRFYLVVIVASMVVAAWPNRGRRKLRIPVLGILFTALLFTTPLLSSLGLDRWLPVGLNEIAARNLGDIASINNEWRGYETYMAFRSAQIDGMPLLLMGHGFAATADLGLSISLAGEDYQRIGIFHNVFAYLIVHYGVLGIGLYLLQFALLAAEPRRTGVPNGSGADRNRLYILALVTLAVGSPVLGGLFNDSNFLEFMMFLLGTGAVLGTQPSLHHRRIDHLPRTNIIKV
jgi:hypothetical protein